jgi:hypothetical protein
MRGPSQAVPQKGHPRLSGGRRPWHPHWSPSLDPPGQPRKRTSRADVPLPRAPCHRQGGEAAEHPTEPALRAPGVGSQTGKAVVEQRHGDLADGDPGRPVARRRGGHRCRSRGAAAWAGRCRTRRDARTAGSRLAAPTTTPRVAPAGSSTPSRTVARVVGAGRLLHLIPAGEPRLPGNRSVRSSMTVVAPAPTPTSRRAPVAEPTPSSPTAHPGGSPAQPKGRTGSLPSQSIDAWWKRPNISSSPGVAAISSRNPGWPGPPSM